MQVRCGTSGYSYPEWKGDFYPDRLPAAAMLRHYAERLPCVELNNTFYRMPKAAVVRAWASQTPETFRFAVKASRRITHSLRLADAAESTGFLLTALEPLAGQLGVILFQLPPTMRADVSRLREFIEMLPRGTRAAFEFRHGSWFDDAVYRVLSDAGMALVGGDVDEPGHGPPLVATGPYGYLRLRRTDYPEALLESWAVQILAQPWREAFVFFKHESLGPSLAARLNTRCAGGVS